MSAAQTGPVLCAELHKSAALLQVLGQQGERGPSASDGQWDGYAWVREVWVGGSLLNP